MYPPATTNVSSLVAFGAGAQIKFHVSQLLATYPSITRITIVNRTINDRVTPLVDSLRTSHPTARFLAICSIDAQVESAVRGADFLCCATPSAVPLFPSDWVRPGTHVILVGSYKPEMAEVDPTLVRRARVLVDSRSACSLEAGELIGAGLAPSDMVEVGELLLRSAHAQNGKWTAEIDAARVAEMLSGRDVTMFKSVGLGVQDVAISTAVMERATEIGIGTRVANWDWV